jgi:hypothetical protein
MEEFICRGILSSLTLESVRPTPENNPGQKEEQRLFVAKLFYDHKGLLIRKQETRKVTFYHYNDQYLLEKEVEIREAEQISREKNYHYSAARLIEEISGNEKITYHYNSRDTLDYTTTWNREIQESICSYNYNNQGLVVYKEIRDLEGELLRSSRFKRNLKGLISEEIVINQENIVLEHNHFEYSVFHGENWLKRECYRLEEGKNPLLTEILYRNISLSQTATITPAQSMEETVLEPSESVSPIQESAEPENNSSRVIEKKLRFKNGLFKGCVNNNNLPHGQGEFWGNDGSRYSGGFSEGRMEGTGNLLQKNGSSYTGEFKKGLPQGKGECLWPDGSRYRGQFYQGEMHGIGSFTWSDGIRFTGLFEHNKNTDQGLLENANPGEEDNKERN